MDKIANRNLIESDLSKNNLHKMIYNSIFVCTI